MANIWNSYLTLVNSLVPRLDVFDLQRPDPVRFRVVGLEAIVSDEGHPVHGEYVIVSHPHP